MRSMLKICFPSRCVHEWVDLYTEVEDTDVSDLISTPFGGRYCGKIPPRRRISLYGGIAIGFYSDKNSTEEGIFKGTFAFINEGMPNFSARLHTAESTIRRKMRRVELREF